MGQDPNARTPHHEAAADRADRAVYEPGVAPGYHASHLRRLATEWPALAAQLGEVAREHGRHELELDDQAPAARHEYVRPRPDA